MARGGRGGKRRTQYVRDAQGQFASTPGGGKKATPSAVRKAAKAAAVKGGTLAARTSLKKSRAKLASFDKADQTIQSSLSKRSQKGAVTRGNKNLTKALKSNRTRLIGVKPNANTIKKNRPVSLAYVAKTVDRAIASSNAKQAKKTTSKAATPSGKRASAAKATPSQAPASRRPGSMTSVLRGTMRALAQADAQRIRDVESMTGQKVRQPRNRKASSDAGDRVRKAAKGGKVSDTLRAGLRELAQSDARAMRGMSQIVKDATPKVSRGKERGKVKGSAKTTVIAEAQKPSGKMYRTRNQSAAAQRDRASMLIERGRNAPGADGSMDKTGSLRVRYKASYQTNLFGGVNKVKSGKRFEYSNTSKIGKSSEAKRIAKRRSKVNARLLALTAQRDKLISSMKGKDFGSERDTMKNLRKIEQSMIIVRRADDFYDSNPKITGRKTKRNRK